MRCALGMSDPGEPGGLVWQARTPTLQGACHSRVATRDPRHGQATEAACLGNHAPWSCELKKSYRIETLAIDLEPATNHPRAAGLLVGLQRSRNCLLHAPWKAGEDGSSA